MAEPIPWPVSRELDRESMLRIGKTLDELADAHNFVSVVVTNKPTGRIQDFVYYVLGRSAWNWHFAESGATCVSRRDYDHVINPLYLPPNSDWVSHRRPQIIADLRDAGFLRYEPGDQHVNIILVNSEIAQGREATDFVSRLQSFVSQASWRDEISLSHGEGGNLADISPLGYGKHNAARWAHARITTWASEQGRDVDWSNSVYFGDSQSDVDFVEEIRSLTGTNVLAAAPGNASEAMRNIATFVSDGEVELGMVDNLSMLLARMHRLKKDTKVASV